MSTFAVRLLDGPADAFVYYDHTEERAGDVPHEITAEWSDHDRADLERVMSMMEGLGYRFEVRGLASEPDPFSPTGQRWVIREDSR